MLSNFDIHPSKRSHNQFNTKFGLKKNSFEHSYEGWNFNSGNYLFTTDTK